MKSIFLQFVLFFSTVSFIASFTVITAENEHDLPTQTRAQLSCLYKKMNDKQTKQLHVVLSSVIDIAAQSDAKIDIQALLADIAEQLAELESIDIE